MRSGFHRSATMQSIACLMSISIGSGCGGSDSDDDGDTDSGDGAEQTEVIITTFPLGPPYDGPTENVTFVAFQDGDSEWVALDGTDGVYPAVTTGQRYGVAVGCVTDTYSTLDLYYQTVSDTREIHAIGCRQEAERVSVSIELLGLDNMRPTEVRLGKAVGYDQGGSLFEFSVPRGTYDLLAVGRESFESYEPALVFRGPTLDIEADQSLTFDFGTMARAPESHPVALAGLDPEEIAIVSSSHVATHSQTYWHLIDRSGPPYSYVALDSAIRQPTDVSTIRAAVTRVGANQQMESREVEASFRTPEERTLTLPDVWSVEPLTVIDPATARVSITIPTSRPSLTFLDYVLHVATLEDALVRILTLSVSSGWLGPESMVTVTTPDLSRLPGWVADLGLFSDRPVAWAIDRFDLDMRIVFPYIDGRHRLINTVSGTIDAAVTSR